MKILGPTDTGKGILIEMDAGYVSPSHEFNKKMLEENHKNFLDYSKPFEFYAVLQKYNTPNRNGRVYPEKILKRESENYKKMISRGIPNFLFRGKEDYIFCRNTFFDSLNHTPTIHPQPRVIIKCALSIKT